MKPCDVRSMEDIKTLKEKGIVFNDKSIVVHTSCVELTVNTCCRVTISHKFFKRFAEWYLEDQNQGLAQADLAKIKDMPY